MDAGSWVWLAAGIVLVFGAVADLTATLVVTWGSSGRWRPTRLFYRAGWRAWSGVCRRIRSVDRQQQLLAVFAPLSLLALLAGWLLSLLIGWSFVWMAFDDKLSIANYGDALYYSGVVLLTIGFGDITTGALAPRLLTLAEAATGLASIALVIAYLPVLYGAYGRRESKLLTLDNPTGERLTPAGVVRVHTPDGDFAHLYDFFWSWEQWVAEVMESHTSYPMLAFFRSQHRGQSWITALGVVLDAATLVAACVEGADERAPFFLYRRGRRAVGEISARLLVAPVEDTFLDQQAFAIAFEMLERTGLRLRKKEEAWNRLLEYRPTYGPELQGLFDYLVAPPGFWGHSADA